MKSNPRPPTPWKAPAVNWPTAATAELTPGSEANPARTVGGLPIRLAAPATRTAKNATAPGKTEVAVKNRAAARAAGVDGLLLTVRPIDATAPSAGPVEVEVDYTSIRGAYAAGWPSRLRLVTLPACALTTPDKPECRKQTPLATENNTSDHTLTATLAPTAAGTGTDGSAKTTAAEPTALTAGMTGVTVLAATAGASGSDGSFKASSLAPSGSWSAGGNSGGFGWNIPIDVPGAPGGLTPKVALSYNSSSIDGRTASTNNQASWIGEGWEYSPGFIERRYASCENDKQGGNNSAIKSGDLCWKSENATLSLNGSSSELIWDAGKKTWKLASDDGSRIERIYDTDPNNSGDEDFEYWKVTTLDGTQYWFGKNRLPGWETGKTETNSVFSVPVYGNHSGEQGHATDFASSAEQQGWRWNLDYVVDPHGNAMALYYTKEQGYYAQNGKIDDPKSYTRGGYLNRIDYGLRAGAVYTTANPAGRVTFSTAPRCKATDCAFTEANKTSWPDTPFDLSCTSGTQCLQASPSFWSKQRLTGISTLSLVGTGMVGVDSWALEQSFPATGDTSTPAMWLDSVQRIGKAGPTADISLNPITFTGELMPNRVDAAEGRPPLYRKRITKITNETGGETLVTYTVPQCTPTNLPAQDANNMRCYPAWWTPDGAVEPVKDWFHKYLVSSVIEDDTTGGSGSLSKTTTYAYSGGPHWRRDTSEFTLDKHRTWNVFRGYVTVNTYTGGTNRVRTSKVYFTGMAGDTLENGSTRPAATINGMTDREDFVGRVASSNTWSAEGGKIVARTTSFPWQSEATATQVVKGITDPDHPETPAPTLPAKTAYLSGTATEKGGILLDDGTTWRTLTTTRTYDTTYGLLTKETDDGAGSVEARCTVTDYVTPDLGNWLIAYPSAVTTTDSTLCLPRPGDITSSARTYYDGNTLGAAPHAGKANVTKLEQLAKHDIDTPPVWETTSEATHDQYGRVLVAKGQDGQPITTTYIPAVGTQPTSVKVANVKGHETSTTFDGLRGLTLSTTDVNGRTASSDYDTLGRLTKAWSTGRAKTLQPNATFTYTISNAAPSRVISKKLYEDGLWGTSVTFYDSLLRTRQTQTDSLGITGRVITDTYYDTHSRPYLTNAPYYNSLAVSTTGMFSVAPNVVPQSFETKYDGRGRVIESVQLSQAVPKWSTTNTYGDYWTTTLPPNGGTATLTQVDARGRTVEERQYKDRNPVPNAATTQYEKTTRTYNSAGLLASLTDSSGRNTWRYTYDLRGRQLTAADPDKGLTSTHYDINGRADAITDSRGTLVTTYDELGRKTTLRTGSVTGTKLAEWTYDTATGGKGLAHKSIRYDTSNASAAYTTELTGYSATGQPTGTKVTVPSTTGEELLAGTYMVAATTTPVSGMPLTAAYSTTNTNATTALPTETVTNHYGSNDTLAIIDSSLDHAYLRGAGYTEFGELAQVQLGNLGRLVTQTLTYDTSTRRLLKNQINREATGPYTLSNITYGYDQVGNITSIRDAQNDGAVTDDQCFTYDWARRLTDAWTSGDACATKSINGTGTPNLGTTDPYRTSWTYTDTGQRKTETQFKAGLITANTTRTYSYPTTAGAAQAHAVTSVTATGGTSGTDSFAYDSTGNLIKKTPAGGAVQDLTWTEEGKLKTSTTSGQTTSFLYDAEGTRIIKRDPTKTTLYLPGGQELELTRQAGSAPAAISNGTRYYSVPGGSVIRTSKDNSVRILVSDHHNTNTLSLSASNLAVNRRKTMPFGGPRGAAPYFWPGAKGFVGGDIDTTTNLTHIGAREYDTNLGQFISVDPILSFDLPQSLDGYSYASNNPVTSSDPTGLREVCSAYGNSCTPTDYSYEEKYVYSPEPNNGGDEGTASGGSGGTPSSGETSAAGSGVQSNNQQPTPSPSPNASPVPGPYPSSNRTDIVIATITFILPDFEAIGNCVSDPGFSGDCGSAALELPWAKPLKVLKLIKPGKVDDLAKKSDLPDCKCFLAGTGVLMADGITKPIEKIEIGDKVLAADPETGEAGPREVTRLIRTESDKNFNTLSIATDEGIEELTATYEHPFWSPSQSDWVEARNLKPGMTLLTDEGATVLVIGSRAFTLHARTYNLTVDDLHTYYVLAGQTPILVHNSNCGVTIDDGKWDYFFGRVNSNPHNAERSAQNAYQLESIGIRDNAAGREVLTGHFNEAMRSGVVETYVNPKSGLTNMRTESLLYGPRGALLIRANFEVTDNGVRLTTMIPIGGRGYGK
ncbi:polymorphic toxin-type HINT domain-containing protein [Streptomyces filamentosus]|uniref:polymorphic toxin-type HINT domain-containing protein n=1 Tax=Streptomyces filamentosus TaxID=67294 RepID=UPI00380A6E82